MAFIMRIAGVFPTIGQIVLWTATVVAIATVEAFWIARLAVLCGDLMTIENYLIQKLSHSDKSILS